MRPLDEPRAIRVGGHLCKDSFLAIVTNEGIKPIYLYKSARENKGLSKPNFFLLCC